MNQIIIRGARQHNLKNIDLTLPRDRFIVITGVSGSGKSSLAFDTLFAEGQRRYMEALSTYARHFLPQPDIPVVDEIQGLSPAVAIEQKGLHRNPRSTVGTLTEIHDHLRLLFARLGTVYCPDCSLPIRAHTIPEMIEEIFRDWPRGSRLLLLAPLGEISEKDIAKTLKRLRRDGFARIRFEGVVHELEPVPHLPRRTSYVLDLVVDRLVLNEDKWQRVTDSFELASKVSGGMVGVARLDGGEKLFSESFRCTSCGRLVAAPAPSLFSFQHPSGACPACKGLGYLASEPDSSPFPNLADCNGALDAETDSAEALDIPDEDRESPREPALAGLESAVAGSRSTSPAVCPLCHGSRLNEAARSVRLGGLPIHEVSRLRVPAVREWIDGLELSATQKKIAARPLQEVLHRLGAMEELGLSYLTMDRSAVTISGGESQRIRLAHQIASPLSGVFYVLDEPSIGLHPRDHQRLLDILFRLRDAGNTVIVVEHDRETILQSDYVVDMGPGAGILGGEVLFTGSPQELLQHDSSLTGQFLSGRKSIPVPARRACFRDGALSIVGAKGHNLKDLTVHFPLGCMTCVTGVSGSGKSTLVLHTLYRALAQRLSGARSLPEAFDRLEGAEHVRKVVLIDQAPIGRTPRSIPATYTGLFSLIRELFSQLPEARARGYGAGRFSFNAKGGRCEVCKGEGLQRIEMFFLPDVYVTCPGCGGARYRRETLDIRFKGRSIAEVLELSVHEAASFFENIPSIHHKLHVLQEVGLGYIRLGQPATTISGGEAQRVKLAAELSRRAGSGAVYILDEPTTGLHFEDIQKLLHVLRKLVDAGHTVIMIEHHPDVVKTADHVIDLGPEGGDEGGYVVATGAPEDIARVEASATGRYLRALVRAR